ncbi:hypothetical protein EDB86DRAFT_2834708 [Lactarius hatsudake]|nr:hypothetical protein EDB86DRAFT_2834708 [Lactarius hatsudake]
MTKASEPALSSLAWLILSVGSGKDEGAGGEAQTQGGGKVILFVLNKIDLVPLANPLAHLKHHCTRTSTLHFLSARAPLSARIPPLLHAPVHFRLLQVSGPDNAVGPIGFWTSAKAASSTRAKVYTMTAQPGHTRELERWFNRPKAANSTPHIKTLRLTSGLFELKKDLGTFRLPDLKVRGSEKGCSPRHDASHENVTMAPEPRHSGSQRLPPPCAIPHALCRKKHLSERRDEPATGLMYATRLVEEESGGQAVRFVFVPDKEGGCVSLWMVI